MHARLAASRGGSAPVRWTETCVACDHRRPVATRDAFQGRMYLHCEQCPERQGGPDNLADGLRAALRAEPAAAGGPARAAERGATPDGAKIAVAPSDMLLLVTEPSADGRVPETLLRALGGAAWSCLAFGALSNHGGTARVSLGDRPRPEVLGAPIFEAVLDTPGRRLAVYTLRAEAILELPVEADRTRVQIWARDPQAPADIEVVVSLPGGDAVSR